MFRQTSLFCLILALVLFTACGPEENITPDIDVIEPPKLPPVEMYMVPFSSFLDTDVDTTKEGKRVFANSPYKNWVYSTVNVVGWNTKVALQTALPLVAFGLAASETPVQLESSAWQWSYEYQAPKLIGGKTYEIVLTATRLENSDVAWKMLISEQGGIQDFEWMEGTVSQDFSFAQFILNQSPSQPETFLLINFDGQLNTSDISSSKFQLRYTNLQVTSDQFKEYLEFRSQPQVEYSRVFDIRGGEAFPDITTEIEYNPLNGTGRVRDLKHFGNAEWHCWNEKLRNEDC